MNHNLADVYANCTYFYHENCFSNWI